MTVDLPPPKASTGRDDNSENQAGGNPDEETAEQVLKQREQEQFEEAKDQLEATLASIPQLKNSKIACLSIKRRMGYVFSLSIKTACRCSKLARLSFLCIRRNSSRS